MVPVLAWPMVLVLPKEKPALGAVVVWPKGLNRLPAGWGAGWPNRPPVTAPKPAAAAGGKREVGLREKQSAERP